MKDALRVILSLAIISATVFALDRLGGEAMWWAFHHTNDITSPKICYVAEQIDEDIVMMGTSRCNYHYVPSTIADSTRMSCYNAGVDASDCIYSHYTLLRLMLRRHTPKVVCLDVMAADFATWEGYNPTETVSFFAPYAGADEQSDSVFRLAGTLNAYRLSHLYRYNAKAASIIFGLFAERHPQSVSGYIPISGADEPLPKLEKYESQAQVDSTKIRYVEKFVDDCLSRGTAVVFVASPHYSIVDSTYYAPLADLARRRGIPFLNYHGSELFTDRPELFHDPTHLNSRGAQRFTEIFAADLRRIVSPKGE
ncbi:MAG: hypothetical protein ACI31D_02470 [Candidatus Limisoma sp.]